MIRNTKISVLTGLAFLALLILSGLSFIAAQAQVYPEPKAAPALNRPHIEGVPPMFVPNAAQVPAMRDSISLSPVADTYVASGRPDQELSGNNWFWVGYEPPLFQIQRTLLEFDVSEIPLETHVNSATLSLFMSQATSDGDMKIEVYRLGSDWPEDITWNQHKALFEGLEDATPVVESEVSREPGWYEWDVSALVQEWVDDPSSNFGMILIGDESVGRHGRKFWSRECDPKCESKLPKLSVEFGVATPTPTPTDTPTPTPTDTPSATNTPTPTPTDTPRPTNTPTPNGPSATPDDNCSHAEPILSDGTVQVHTFDQPADDHWVSFQASDGVEYLIEGRVPPSSPANLALEVFEGCGGLPKSEAPPHSPDIRYRFVSSIDGQVYLHLFNNEASVYGSEVEYHLSVRALNENAQHGALIIVAGKYEDDDPLQDNIHNVTDRVYEIFRGQGHPKEQIYYLATDQTLDPGNDGHSNVDARPNVSNLRAAITQWAAERVGPDRALTLFMMDHGGYDKFFLDGPRNERLKPADLDSWLTELEEQTNAKVNVLIEACQSGSFIDPKHSISKEGRVVIAATDALAPSYASHDGAIFSDALLSALAQGKSLKAAFDDGKWAISERPEALAQNPWLDSDGNGIPNQPSDNAEAERRGLAIDGSFPTDRWSPYIAQAEIRDFTGTQGKIWAQVLDDQEVKDVWAVVYPPSYKAPESESNEEIVPIVPQPSRIPLLEESTVPHGVEHSIDYPLFNEKGEYRVVIYAKDDDGLIARPKEITIQTGWQLYLPAVLR